MQLEGFCNIFEPRGKMSDNCNVFAGTVIPMLHKSKAEGTYTSLNTLVNCVFAGHPGKRINYTLGSVGQKVCAVSWWGRELFAEKNRYTHGVASTATVRRISHAW